MFGKAVQRNVSYQLYGSDNAPLTSGTITEHLFAIDYHAAVIRGDESSGLPNGQFNDEISVQFGYDRNYLQSFTVQGSSYGLSGFANVPVFVQGWGREYGILAVNKTFTFVDINGDRGLNPNGSLHMCDK
jgi:hypothetical protein